MDYNEIYNKFIALEKQKFELAKAAAKKRRYMNLFNLSINIISNLNHLRKIIKEFKTS